MARDGDDRLATITLFTTMTDFTEVGEISVFMDTSEVTFLEDMMWERGYLDPKQAGGGFQLLKSRDLIWSKMIREYFLGQREPMFDLMAWNADGTRMPYRQHSELLRRLYRDNELFEGKYPVDGRPIRISDIHVPIFCGRRREGPRGAVALGLQDRPAERRHRTHLRADQRRPQRRHRQRAGPPAPQLPPDHLAGGRPGARRRDLARRNAPAKGPGGPPGRNGSRTFDGAGAGAKRSAHRIRATRRCAMRRERTCSSSSRSASRVVFRCDGKGHEMEVWELRDGFGLEHLRRAERPDPVPGPGEVLLAMRAASLNYRDTLAVRGGYGPRYTLPLIPVSDGVGEVIAVGRGVTRVREGDRVAPIFFQSWIGGPPSPEKLQCSLGGDVDGVLATRMCVPAEAVVGVPEHLSDAEAASLPCAGVTAWSAVITQGAVGPSDVVLVQGTGGVALFALLFAKAAGARVIITSSDDAKLERARALGADADDQLRRQSGLGPAGQGDDGRCRLRSRRRTGRRRYPGAFDPFGPHRRHPEPDRRAQRRQGGGGTAAGGDAQPAPARCDRRIARRLRRHGARHRPAPPAPPVDRVFAFDEVPAAFAHFESRGTSARCASA